jgi:isoleucyl-tRNA synthetase
VVYREIEKARQEKVIGNSLEAAVVYHVPVGHLRDAWQGQESIVEEIMMVGSFRLEARTDEEHAHASVSRTPHKKCARCWRHRAYVGTSKEHPDLCDRCEKVVARVTSKVGST